MAANSRLEALKGLVAQQPNDSFLRYGLAMEYQRAGDAEAAIAEFRALLAANPDYLAAYYHGGRTLESEGRAEEAREWYRRGIDEAERQGDRKTRDELQAALELSG